jgi:citrate synthase
MCGGVGGSPAAADLMAALAVGAGQYGGAREVFLLLRGWNQCGTDLDLWRAWLAAVREPPRRDTWPTLEHAPGFDPHGASTPTVVRQTLARLAAIVPPQRLAWLAREREALERIAASPLAMSAVAAAALADLGFSPEQGEMLHLLLRLPGAAAHALEQRESGLKKFPFFTVELENDPADNEATMEKDR